MRYDLIKTDNYLLICDDSETKVGDYIYDLDLQKIVIANDLKAITSKSTNCWYYKKIVAHLPINGAPVIDVVPILPSLPQEDGIQDIVKNYVHELIDCKSVKEHERTWISAICHQVIIHHREKYKFTEEDMMMAIENYSDWVQDVDSDTFYKTYKLKLYQIIQSIEQPTPIAFECEIEPQYKHIGAVKDVKGSGDKIKNKNAGKPKTIINFDGRVEWVGKYIWK